MRSSGGQCYEGCQSFVLCYLLLQFEHLSVALPQCIRDLSGEKRYQSGGDHERDPHTYQMRGQTLLRVMVLQRRQWPMKEKE